MMGNNQSSFSVHICEYDGYKGYKGYKMYKKYEGTRGMMGSMRCAREMRSAMGVGDGRKFNLL